MGTGMVIRTIRETYRVICTLKGSQGMNAYLCLREGSCDEEKFLVMGAKNRELSEGMLRYFMDLFYEQSIPDFEDCFVKEGILWVVFRYFFGVPFLEKQRNKNPIEERMNMARELVEQILTQHLPLYLQYESCNPANLVVSEKWGVRVNFLLFEPEKMKEDVFPLVQKRMAEYFQMLFAEELEGEAFRELNVFVERLQGADFPEGIGLYRAYRRLEEQLKSAKAEGKFIKKGYLTRLWRKVFRWSKDIFLFWYWVLIGGLLGLLIFVCIVPETAPKERNFFQSIGTLEITGYGSLFVPETESGGEETERIEDIKTQETESTETKMQKTEVLEEKDTQETEPAEKSRAEMG